MVQIRNIKDKSADLWRKSKDGSYETCEGAEYVGEIKTILQFNDVRVQIKELKSSEYFLYFDGSIYDIDKDGRIPDYPNGLFDEVDNFLDKLI